MQIQVATRLEPQPLALGKGQQGQRVNNRMDKNRSSVVIPVWAILLLLVCVVNSVSTDAADSPVDSETTIAATVTARSILGGAFAVQDGEEAKAVPDPEVCVYKDSTTPFLSEDLDGREAWRFEFDDVRPLFDSQKDDSSSMPGKSAVMWVDKNTGQLLRAEIRTTDTTALFAPLPNAEEMEEERRMIREEYNGLPERQPHFGLTEVLLLVRPYVMSSTWTVVLYVKYSRPSARGISAWVVQTYGPIRLTDRYFVIDAVTGKMNLERYTVPNQ